MTGFSPIMGPHSLLGIEKHSVTFPILVLVLSCDYSGLGNAS